MPVTEIYIKLIVGFHRDPKVRALVRYGADAGLGRDLYVSMLLYCKENLTDGYVPAEEVGVLAYPLPVDHANQIAKQLASVGLIKEVSNGEQQGWLVGAYIRRNGTKEDVENLSRVRAEAGRKGGRPRRETARQRPAQANENQIGKQVAKQSESRPNPETESETETDQSSRRNTPASEDPPRLQLAAVAELADRYGRVLDDEDLLSAVIKTIHARTGRSIDSGDARRIAADILAAAKRQVGNPVAYVTKTIEREKDPAGRWLSGPGEYQPPMLFSVPASSMPDQHAYEPDAYGTCLHDGCGLPKTNRRHLEAS